MLSFSHKDKKNIQVLRTQLAPLVQPEMIELLERIETNMMNGKTVEKKRISKKQRTIKYL